MNREDRNEKDKKAGNPFLILIIFVVLMGFLFIVPDVYKKYNSDIADFLGIGSKPLDDSDTNEQDDKLSISTYYQIGSKESLEFNEIMISDVSLANNILTFTVSVKDATDESESTNLDALNYYVEFYQNKKTFIGRRSLKGDVVKSEEINIDLSNLNVDTTTYFVLSHISDEAIGGAEIESDESGKSLISCIKGSESYEYEFYLKKLSKVTYSYNYNNENLGEYASTLLDYQKKEKRYNEFNGVTAKIVENSNAFVFISEFDYANIASFSGIGDNRVFTKDIYNNVVKFKMEAEGFDCK